MSESYPTRGVILARRSSSVLAVATVALAFAAACNDGDGLRAPSATGGGGAGGDAMSHAGSGGATPAGAGGGALADAAGGHLAGDAGAGGVMAGDAGAGGDVGDVGGDAGAAGEPGQVSNCLPGGVPLVVGSYRDAVGNQLLLRSAAKAATFALIPAGAPNPALPPRLFLVNRVCSSGGGLLASDASSSYRVDYIQNGTRLAVCFSAPVTTLEAALALSPADPATGCGGQPFTVYSAEVL